MTARCYLLASKYQSGKSITEEEQQDFLQKLPADAQKWWEDYDIGARFHTRCQKDVPGTPLDILPFTFA